MSTAMKNPSLPPRAGVFLAPERSSIPREQPKATTASPIVFSWNDFLCPVAWILHHRPATAAELDATARLDRRIVDLLVFARSLGPVYVICDSSAASIEDLCAAWFPLCARLFSTRATQQHIRLVCAAGPISSTWHGQILDCIIRGHRKGASITIFGHKSLRDGCIAVADHYAIDLLPRFKMIQANSASRPTAEDVLRRLEVVRENIALVADFHSPIDSTLSL
ncbi:Aste57867_10636 [Aphanomyces stellatus]|uniref:Aste57867_10636 protein n=1 Tax=Aphanomyces stellatus TaxID=120398 RepID=A0A485KRY9_9STRA|nr:hypothetical protein As57867_010596 [Aphanomyces stellatus]VFT87508.1 Aste57867_10636 [Aphanomyces stellatus]